MQKYTYLFILDILYAKMRILLIINMLLLNLYSYSQWNENTNILMHENNNILLNGLSGGLNNCQFSEVDLNQNNTKDLVVFDRNNGKIYPFINQKNSA